MTCHCANPDPVEITDETFEGLFADTPIVAHRSFMCGRCGREIVEDDGPYALPDEFDDDDQTCDYNDEVIT